MEISAAAKTAAAVVTSIGIVGGGGIALDKLHVPASDFEQYIEQQQMADDRAYVQDLKKDIREITGALLADPGEVYLIEARAELIDELCEIRPDDNLCDG